MYIRVSLEVQNVSQFHQASELHLLMSRSGAYTNNFEGMFRAFLEAYTTEDTLLISLDFFSYMNKPMHHL